MRLSLLLLPAVLSAQALTISAPPTARPGDVVTAAITHNVPEAVAFEWTIQLPSGVTAAASTTAPRKTLDCRMLKCLLYGRDNADLIPQSPEQAASISVTIPANQPAGSSVAIVLAGVKATNAVSAPLTVTGSQAVILIPAREDLTGDGVVDGKDVDAATEQHFGTCGTADFDGDGVCTVYDVQRVLAKMLKLIP